MVVGFVCMGKVGHRGVVKRILEYPENWTWDNTKTVTCNYFYTAVIELSNKGKKGFLFNLFHWCWGCTWRWLWVKEDTKEEEGKSHNLHWREREEKSSPMNSRVLNKAKTAWYGVDMGPFLFYLLTVTL